VNYHAGNEHFRALVRKHKVVYVACPKQQKGKFSRLIGEEIRARIPPGRFLKQDHATMTNYFDAALFVLFCFVSFVCWTLSILPIPLWLIVAIVPLAATRTMFTFTTPPKIHSLAQQWHVPNKAWRGAAKQREPLWPLY
jgi:hypothetical protein